MQINRDGLALSCSSALMVFLKADDYWNKSKILQSNKQSAGGNSIVKPHQRLIKFPDRKASPQPNVREALKSMSVSIQRQQPTTTNSLSSAAAPISQLPGTRDTVEIVRALPQKYRRLPVSQEEMEYIQRGGPE
ncbi:28S ribosomal protein S36, mitochondrial isoform X1 [Pristis pectinata]|uniref:28S ribosomal protein S36, mitochondrial isoform X1 n=1 Tax=Pristis pectinata TaxID=685728 RepID=UPI00223CF5DD|nr:28S ribosomal protein S36, mitochondrial isoform X1 [Pristis pectinata]